MNQVSRPADTRGGGGESGSILVSQPPLVDKLQRQQACHKHFFVYEIKSIAS
jgi:hypothetical protein